MRHRILQAATDRAERFRPILDEFAALTPIAAAAALNERNVPSPRGGRWYAVQVVRMRKRLAAGPPRKARKSVMERECLARNDVGVENWPDGGNIGGEFFHGQASCRVGIRSHTFGWRCGGHLHPHEEPLH